MSNESGHDSPFHEAEDFSDTEATRRIFLHVYDDESKEFSSLTTYHGMVRIYNSATWPSLIFWCLVVTLCLILFMVHSGYLLTVYQARPTFLDLKHIRNKFPHDIKPVVTFCERFLGETNYSNRYITKLECETFFAQIKVGNKKVSCNDVTRHSYAQFGSCFTLDYPSWSLSESLSVFIQRLPETDLAFEVHEKKSPSNLFAQGVHVFEGTHITSHVSVTAQQFLEKKLWGNCEQSGDTSYQNLESCQQKCLQNLLVEKCHCLPDYFGKNKTNCASRESINCIESALIKPKPCKCSLPCYRISFSVRETSMAKLPSLLANSSKITIHFKDKTLIVQKQSLRLVTVDLLSFVAGSMGLFLGMSCITLLEVFMYLFKSVWGTMNNARYKAYLSKLLGENVSNLLYIEPDMSRSHEQIVITQTMNSEANGRESLQPVTLQFKHSLTNRKFSIQIGNKDAQMLILPSQQRFRAQSHRGFLSSFNNSFETVNPTKFSPNSFDYDAF